MLKSAIKTTKIGNLLTSWVASLPAECRCRVLIIVFIPGERLNRFSSLIIDRIRKAINAAQEETTEVGKGGKKEIYGHPNSAKNKKIDKLG